MANLRAFVGNTTPLVNNIYDRLQTVLDDACSIDSISGTSGLPTTWTVGDHLLANITLMEKYKTASHNRDLHG